MAGATRSDETKYLLVCNTSDGLIAQVNGVVAQLQLARRLGLEPIVHLNRRSNMFGGPNPYFEESQGLNVWDYYFEPIGPTSGELPALIKDGRVFTLSTASELARLFRWEPRSWFMNPYGYYRSVENTADGDYPADWWLAQRVGARPFFTDGTIRFKAAILDQVKRFTEKYFTEHTLGLQLRGSDKFDFGVGPNLSRKVLPEEYFPYIDRHLAEHGEGARIFVATDQRQWLKSLEETYPGKILSFSEKSLADTNENRFNDTREKAARGGEVLVDALLLSHCSSIVKCHAAVGEIALVLNPKLGFIDLNYAVQPFEARSRLFRPVVTPAIRVASSIWRRLSENGLALAKVVSVEDDRILVGDSRPRPLNTKEAANLKAPRASLFSRRFVSDAFDQGLEALAKQCFVYRARGSAN